MNSFFAANHRRVRAAGYPLLAGLGAVVATMLFVRRAHNSPELAAFPGLRLPASAVQPAAEVIDSVAVQG